MRRVIAVLMLLCASCVDRTENLDFSTNASVELEIPEMVTTDGGIGGIEGQKTAENGRMPKEKYNNGTSEATEATGKDENATYSSENGAKTASNHTDRESISEAVFYIFDENGLFMSKNIFAGGDDYKLNFTKNGRHSVYVLCNISEFADLPASPSQDELESLTIPHRESYDRLPFAGKTEVNVTPGEKPAIKIKLDRINSAIRIENHSADRMELTRITVNGLPNRGNIFGTDTEAADVTYSESAEAEIDAEGNAVVYSFFVPENKIANVKIEAEARVKDTEETGTTAATIAPLTFIDRLETGKQATALVGYMENGNIKIGSPDNWGNVGKYELPGGVRLQVIGGEFFDYKSAKALRAYSGGSEFSFVVEAADGVATLQTVGTAEWVEIRDNIIVVSANPAAAERECQVSVSVGGKNVGVFYIVQGKAITFSCTSLSVVNNRLEKVGGTGSGSAVYTVTFDMSDDELAATEIAPEGNGENGITVEVNRSAKTVSVHFMALVDASQVGAEGVSVPVRFLDVNGTEQACLEVVQRPARITFNPVRYKNISYLGGTVTASVTVEGDAKWNVNSILDKGGKPVDAWLTGPATGEQFDSGSNLVLTVSPNGTSAGRTAYVTVKSRYTLSKPYEITQAPSYGVKNITVSNGLWDAATFTLKVYSGSDSYDVSFETETHIPENSELKVDYEGSWIDPSEVKRISDNKYSFSIFCEDSYSTKEEETTTINVTANGEVICSFMLIKALWPSFNPERRDIWGGVKNRSELKSVNFRVSDWDKYSFSTNDDRLTVKQVSDNEIEIGYAETLRYDDEAIDTYISMDLNRGSALLFYTTQSPILFDINETELQKLLRVSKEATDVDITINTQAGTSGAPWHVASTSESWLTTNPAVGGTETNASGSTLTVKFAANTEGDRTGSFVLESQNTTSPTYDVSQKGAFSATINSVLYNGSSSAVFAGGVLKAFSAAYDYTFNITTNNAVEGNRLTIVSKTSGTAVTVKTSPSGTVLATSHSFVMSVPASTLTTEPESVFDIMVDGNRIGGFTVKQAKKPSISVNTATTVGGSSSAVSGSFTASTWDLKSTNYVTSSSSTLTIANPSTAGTFLVNMKSSFLQTDDNLTATITLVGVNGNLGTCSIAQNKVVYAFSPTSLKFEFDETSAGKTVTVTSSNAGTISSGMTAKSSDETWCTVTVAGNVVTAKVTENTGNTSRTATVYVTYKNSRSQTFDVVQDSDGPATITIGGLQWTLYNLANPAQASGGATFATKLPSQCTGVRSDSHGRFYQWNRNVSWNTIGSSASGANPSGTWQTTNPSGTSWTTTPCPSGFRLPTNTEFQNLINACNATYMSGSWSSSNYGYITLTDKSNSANKLEFPAVGYRSSSDGTLGSNIGAYGYYWSSVQSSSGSAHNMGLNSSSVSMTTNNKQHGFSVRCVRQ